MAFNYEQLSPRDFARLTHHLHHMDGSNSAANRKHYEGAHVYNCKAARFTKSFKALQHRYRCPKGFPTWEEIASTIAFFEDTKDIAVENASNIDIAVAFLSGVAVRDRSPLRFLSKNMAEAFLRTKDRALEKPEIPFDHFMITVPDGVLVDDWGSSIVVIIVTTTEHFSDVYMSRLGSDNGITFELPEPGLRLVGLSRAGTAMVGAVTWAGCGAETPLDLDAGDGMGEFNDEDVKDVCRAMQRIAVHSMLIMSAKPELVTEEPPPRPTNPGRGFGGMARDALQSSDNVVWIGKDYVPATASKKRAGDAAGTPKAAHWRSGHWHTVRHGERRKQRRLEWFEPVYVNA